VFAVIDQLMDRDVPYLSFSGGEPMLHPQFFAMVERVCARGAELKIETNGHYLTPDNCARSRSSK
jgi:MoaA/NifB/PqqE/SkfB family radical SAM enzyme